MKLYFLVALIPLVLSIPVDLHPRRVEDAPGIQRVDVADDDGNQDHAVLINENEHDFDKDGDEEGEKNHQYYDQAEDEKVTIVPLEGQAEKTVLIGQKERQEQDEDEGIIATTIVEHAVTPKTTTATITPETTTGIVTEKFAVQTITPETTTSILFPNTTTAIITPKTTTGIVTKKVRVVTITPETTTKIVTPETTTRIFYPDTTTRTEIITPETTTRIVTPETTTGTIIHVLEDEDTTQSGVVTDEYGSTIEGGSTFQDTTVYTDEYGSTIVASTEGWANGAISDRAKNMSAFLSIILVYVFTKMF